eukprot:4714990-Pyramimonas_sp.AAC.2
MARARFHETGALCQFQGPGHDGGDAEHRDAPKSAAPASLTASPSPAGPSLRSSPPPAARPRICGWIRATDHIVQ